MARQKRTTAPQSTDQAEQPKEPAPMPDAAAPPGPGMKTLKNVGTRPYRGTRGGQWLSVESGSLVILPAAVADALLESYPADGPGRAWRFQEVAGA